MLEPLQGPQPGPRCACPLLKAWVSQIPPGPLVCGGDRIKVKLRGCSQVSGTVMFLGLLWGPWGRVSPLGAGLPSQNGSSRSWAAQGFHSFLPGPAAPTKARLSGVDARSIPRELWSVSYKSELPIAELQCVWLGFPAPQPPGICKGYPRKMTTPRLFQLFS